MDSTRSRGLSYLRKAASLLTSGSLVMALVPTMPTLAMEQGEHIDAAWSVDIDTMLAWGGSERPACGIYQLQ